MTKSLDRIRLSAVAYLNTKPFLFGIYSKALDEQLDMTLDIPSVCAQKLRAGEVDLGLIPVAMIPHIPEARIVSDFCIGTPGEVKTVGLFAERPIQELRRLFLDYHSRSSAALTRYLLKEHWHLKPQLIQAYPGYEQEIQGDTGGLIIGDRAIGLEKHYPYVYDLGLEWKQHSGLPFVFAAWVANKALPSDFLRDFNAALAHGVQRIPQVAAMFQSAYPHFSTLDYFEQYIDYHLDAPKKTALNHFLSWLRKEQTTHS